MASHVIINTEKSDLEFIYLLFEQAIAYQKSKNYPSWPGYDKEVLNHDIEHGLQYKLVETGEIAYIFSICYTDKIIWREKDDNDAVYLHRMVVNPKYKGARNFGKVLEWLKVHCKKQNRHFVRMDTWADNKSIVDYYRSFGFTIVEYFHTPDTDQLPLQQRNNKVVLLELQLERTSLE